MNRKVSILLPSLLLGVIASSIVTMLRPARGFEGMLYFLLLLIFAFPLSMLVEGSVRQLIHAVQEKTRIVLWSILTLLSPVPLIFYCLMMIVMI